VTLDDLIKERGLTGEALGFLADLHESEVSRIRNGLVTPQPETTVRLARALGMSVKRLLGILAETAAAAKERQRHELLEEASQ
jgi:transcriptional regulator with XRE-family HTH domain